MYLLGLVHGEVLEERPDAGHDFGEITRACLDYIKEDQDNFKRDEVQRIVYLLHHSPKHLGDLGAMMSHASASIYCNLVIASLSRAQSNLDSRALGKKDSKSYHLFCIQ